MRNSNIKKLATCAVMLALAFVLSYVKFYEMPNGGALTLLSMLPLCLVSIKYGLGWGLGTAFCYSLIQLFIDLPKAMGWGLTPQAWIGMILFDYIVAFTVLGLAGILRKHGRVGFCIGCGIALALRYLSSVLSGAVVWQSVGEVLGLTFENTWLFSLVYNGAYMVPEIILTMAAALIISALPQVKKLMVPEE